MTHHSEFRRQYEKIDDTLYCFGQEVITRAYEHTQELFAKNKYYDQQFETMFRGRIGEMAVYQWLDDNRYSPISGPPLGADLLIPDEHNRPQEIEVKTRSLHLPARPTDRVNVETRQVTSQKNRAFIFACSWRIVPDELIAVRVCGWLHGHEITDVMELVEAGQLIGRHGKTAHKAMWTCTLNKLRPMETL